MKTAIEPVEVATAKSRRPSPSKSAVARARGVPTDGSTCAARPFAVPDHREYGWPRQQHSTTTRCLRVIDIAFRTSRSHEVRDPRVPWTDASAFTSRRLETIPGGGRPAGRIEGHAHSAL